MKTYVSLPFLRKRAKKRFRRDKSKHFKGRDNMSLIINFVLRFITFSTKNTTLSCKSNVVSLVMNALECTLVYIMSALYTVFVCKCGKLPTYVVVAELVHS